ncbi:Vacuolar membrane-associated protein IML1 [Gracilariopsis chorda]|uniref:Vacuolar membrane-associated protein IML1 n=1 Tax=Gracilariopsis chorda TaxID=448386 RepID=A0A2V3IHR8_9FLOR|nr:Vacuolar membrane-associated protein IML1 [Gracilariopsis chorda]|eukprot:PXF41611.1 Vacuolar membrane-associated protein IML1 [Gracilariopsis chorda]
MYSAPGRKRKASEQVVPGVLFEPGTQFALFSQASYANPSRSVDPFDNEHYPIPNFKRVYSLMRDPENGVPLSDRRWRLSTYSKCFVGKEAVQWMVDNLSLDRKAAVETGQKLMDAGIMHHVTHSEPFSDDYFFYRFQEDDDGNVLNMKRVWDSNIPTRHAVVVAKDLLTRLACICEEHRKRILQAHPNSNNLQPSQSAHYILNSQPVTPLLDPTKRSNLNDQASSPRAFRSISTPIMPSIPAARSPMLVSPALKRRLSQTRPSSHKDNDVDYSSLAKSEHFRKYTLAAAELQRVQLVALNQDERIAFFVNVYNALCLHAHVVHGHPNSVFRRYVFFRLLSYRIAGLDMTLDDIEHGILRGNKKPPMLKFIQQLRPYDPKCQHVLTKRDGRIHFVISAGTKSDPPIRILDGDNVQEELDDAAEEFLSFSVKVDIEKRSVTLPRIFYWYLDDFPHPEKSLLLWVASYLSVEESQQLVGMVHDEKPLPTLLYADFDWSNPEARFNASVVRRKRRRLERERDLDVVQQDTIGLSLQMQVEEMASIFPATPTVNQGMPIGNIASDPISYISRGQNDPPQTPDLTNLAGSAGAISQEDTSKRMTSNVVNIRNQQETQPVSAENGSNAKPAAATSSA